MGKYILVVNFGNDSTHLIVKKVSKIGCHVHQIYPEYLLKMISEGKLDNCSGMILSGSPKSIHDYDLKVFNPIKDPKLPVLGICFGHQLIAELFNGKVKRIKKDYGVRPFFSTDCHPLFFGTPPKQDVWMEHEYSVVKIPDGMKSIGISVNPDGKISNYAAIAHEKNKYYGLQFHPEVDETEYGLLILRNFLYIICDFYTTSIYNLPV
jgi:GMP synthase (glutamine-hydrolysing)